jgi:FKBP-type peptidyl-prolyl cis-trans isomerase SlyD
MDIGMEYTLTVDGEVVDTTDGKAPFHYVHGQGQILEALEQQLEGMHIGDSKEVNLTPEQGYGALNPEAMVEITKDRLPTDMVPEVGMVLEGMNPETSQAFQATIKEVKPESVILDLNHPLAGKSLNFKIKIVELNSALPVDLPPAAN